MHPSGSGVGCARPRAPGRSKRATGTLGRPLGTRLFASGRLHIWAPRRLVGTASPPRPERRPRLERSQQPRQVLRAGRTDRRAPFHVCVNTFQSFDFFYTHGGPRCSVGAQAARPPAGSRPTGSWGAPLAPAASARPPKHLRGPRICAQTPGPQGVSAESRGAAESWRGCPRRSVRGRRRRVGATVSGRRSAHPAASARLRPAVAVTGQNLLGFNRSMKCAFYIKYVSSDMFLKQNKRMGDQRTLGLAISSFLSGALLACKLFKFFF